MSQSVERVLNVLSSESPEQKSPSPDGLRAAEEMSSPLVPRVPAGQVSAPAGFTW